MDKPLWDNCFSIFGVYIVSFHLCVSFVFFSLPSSEQIDLGPLSIKWTLSFFW